MKRGGEVNYCQFERSFLKILQKEGRGNRGGRGGFFSWAFFAAKRYMVFG